MYQSRLVNNAIADQIMLQAKFMKCASNSSDTALPWKTKRTHSLSQTQDFDRIAFACYRHNNNHSQDANTHKGAMEGPK